MSGRPVHLLAAATIAAAASVFSASSAFANCYGCGPSVGYQAQFYQPPVYQAPVVSYAAPVVYGASYQAPVAYPAPVQYAPGCGCAARSPMYVVNQGPAFNAPVVGTAEPIPAYEPGYRSYPYYADGRVRWHRRQWNRDYGYRGYGMRGYEQRYGYRGHGQRSFSYRGYGHRYGAVMPGARYSMRHPMVGGMHRPHMHRPMMGMHHPMGGPGGIHRGPRHGAGAVPHRMGGMRPGSVHPMGAPKQMP
jgi:hypothetical protein